MSDASNAFIEMFDEQPTQREGLLTGLTFAVKDNIASAGRISGNGNPIWRRKGQPEHVDATVVSMLRQAGARLIGRTHMDELAYSLMGINAHYGTPLNPASPRRVPGGSSSGSASAVASGRVDFSLGTDTGGSVRLPAAFCGIYGMRPTHGLVSIDGVVPLAPSYDTVGWFSKSASVLAKVGRVLGGAGGMQLPCLWMPHDVWNEPRPGYAPLRVLIASLQGLFAEFERQPLPVPSPERRLHAFAICQGSEVWETLGDWVTSNRSAFAADIASRLETAAGLRRDEVEAALAVRADHCRALNEVIDGRVLVLPTAPDVAPFLQAPGDELLAYRREAISLLSIAGHAGLPQISIPLTEGVEAPLGLSLIGPRGSDQILLAIAERMERCA